MAWLSDIGRDARGALRLWRRRPGFAFVALASLALGIGANTTVFTMARAVFAAPVPVPDPARAVFVFTRNQAIAPNTDLPTSYWNLHDYGQRNNVFSGFSTILFSGVSWQRTGKPEPRVAELVNADFFPLLGQTIAPGRNFLASEDDAPGAHPVVVLSHQAWVRDFGASAGAIGQTMSLDGIPFTVIGVAPASFDAMPVLGGVDLWMPMAMHDQVLTGIVKQWFNQRERHFALAVARLRPGVGMVGAQQAMHALAQQLDAEFPTDNRGNDAVLEPVSESNIAPNQRAAFVTAGMLLAVIAGLVLLIACANVANLLLVRAAERKRELAVRQALGAGRARIIRQMLTENLLLALVAAGLGIALARVMQPALWAMRPPGAGANVHLALDGWALLFTFVSALGATLLFGLLPALRASGSPRLGGQAALGDRSESGAGGLHWYSARGMLVAAQVAFSLIALAGAALFVHSLINAEHASTGFATDHLVEIGGLTPLHPDLFTQAAIERLRTLPGVAAASASDSVLLQGGTSRLAFRPSQDLTDMRQGKLTPVPAIEPGYFHTLGIPILAGRDISPDDTATAPMVAVVNQAFANEMWPGHSPLGEHLRFNLETWDVTVIGEVPTVKYLSLGETPQPQVYFSLAQHLLSPIFVVRTTGDPSPLLASLRTALHSLDSSLPPANPRMVSDTVARQLAAPRLGAELLAMFGVLALLLAAVGTYGVMAYGVIQRRREIGIRMALGASRAQVMGLVLGSGMAMVAAGVGAGLLIVALASRSLAGLLYGLSGSDPASMALAAVVLVAMGLVACWLPARRALRTDVNRALRED